MEEELITQMGLLLTQMGKIATALDQVSQATSRYAGFAFAEAFTPGGRFGAPPVRDGALLVHVVNLRDLVASSGVAGFFEGLLGGIGRFFGGLIGGVVGGTIAGVALPVMIGMVSSIVSNIDRIIARLGLTGESAAAAPATPPGTPPPSSGAGQIAEMRDILSLVTGLFEAAGTGAPDPRRRELIATPQMQQWQTMLLTVQNIVEGVTRVVRGLIILVPILVGSLALLIDKLDSIKLAFVEMLSFLVRNVLLLRGVVLVTLFDLLAAAARLVAGLVQVIGQMVQGLLRALFDVAATVLEGALAVFRFLAGALQRTVNGMLRWLVDTLFVVLARFGDLRIFRLVTHLVQVLPAVLPPLYELLRGSSPALTPTQQAALDSAAALALPSAALSSTTLPSTLLPAMPNPADLAIPAAELATLRTNLNTLRDGLLRGVGDLATSVQTGFATLAARFDQLVRDELDHSRGDYADRLRAVRENSAAFAEAFSAAERAVRERPASGMEAIAAAYEQWLAGPGLTTLLGQITDFFRDTPASATTSLPGQIVGGPVDRPRASIEIDEVVIDLGPAADGGSGAGGAIDPEALLAQLREYFYLEQLRGGSPDLVTA